MQNMERDPIAEAKIFKELIEKSMKYGTPLIGDSEEIIRKAIEKKKKVSSLKEYATKEYIADSRAKRAFRYFISKESTI